MEHAVPTRQVRVQIPSRVEGCPYLTEAASPFSVRIAKRGSICYSMRLTWKRFHVLLFHLCVPLSPFWRVIGRDPVDLKVDMEGTSRGHAPGSSE